MSVEFNENYLTALTQVDERSKSNSHRLDEAEADIRDLKEKNTALYEINSNIRTLSEGILTVKNDIQEVRTEQGEMKSDIAELKNVPTQSKAKAFDTAWKFIVTAIATGLVSFILGQLVPNVFK
jgi:predicted  nucleic acid-binding Zn-ribbon protein